MVRLEIQYLNEIGRVTYPAISILDSLGSSLGLSVCNAPFSAIVKAAEGLTWTRDPFDRLIVAQASLLEAPLLPKDEKIRAHYPKATW